MHTCGSGPSSISDTSGNVNGKRKYPTGSMSVYGNKPTRKKGKASSSAIPHIQDLEINEETMSFY